MDSSRATAGYEAAFEEWLEDALQDSTKDFGASGVREAFLAGASHGWTNGFLDGYEQARQDFQNTSADPYYD